MENQVDNSLRAFTAQRNPANVSYQQRQNSSFLQKDYQSAWNFNYSLKPDFLILLIKIIQVLLNEFIRQNNQSEYRSFDGTGNNQQQPGLGSANQLVNRILTPDPGRELKADGTTAADLPGAREISNAVSAQEGMTGNRKGLSDLFWLWGQFLDHDITLIEGHQSNPANIAVPEGDPWFDPAGTGTAEIRFNRNDAVTDAMGQARNINEITAFIDGSNVYGSTQEAADALRSFEGGKLKVGADNLLPKAEDGQYIAGDVRSNENVGLTAMHTLWVREHNRIAEELGAQYPDWGDEKIFQEARQKVIAEMQAITYNEFLPHLLGAEALSAYQGYDAGVDPQMTNAFSTAAYRFGHTMLSPELLRLDANGREIPEGNLALRDAFFQPDKVSEAGIDPILRGAAAQTAQAVDPMIVDDVRNFLFGPPGAGGLDLASLNIQRGRDHSLPGYNDARTQLGLSRIESFDDPIWKDGVGAKLAQVYDHPDEVDLWVAGLAEKHVGDSLLGETSTTILIQQFENLRDGDRFWYENRYSGQALQALNSLSLADIIRRNTGADEVQDNAMVASNLHLDQPATRIMMQSQPGATGQSNREVPDNADVQRLQEINQRLNEAVLQGRLG